MVPLELAERYFIFSGFHTIFLNMRLLPNQDNVIGINIETAKISVQCLIRTWRRYLAIVLDIPFSGSNLETQNVEFDC